MLVKIVTVTNMTLQHVFLQGVLWFFTLEVLRYLFDLSLNFCGSWTSRSLFESQEI